MNRCTLKDVTFSFARYFCYCFSNLLLLLPENARYVLDFIVFQNISTIVLAQKEVYLLKRWIACLSASCITGS